MEKWGIQDRDGAGMKQRETVGGWRRMFERHEEEVDMETRTSGNRQRARE